MRSITLSFLVLSRLCRVSKLLIVQDPPSPPHNLQQPRNRVARMIFNDTRRLMELGGVIFAPDNRTVVDAAATGPLPTFIEIEVEHRCGFDLPDSLILTAELEDGPNWKAGSALWLYKAPCDRFLEGNWTLLAELPCCGSVWTSITLNTVTEGTYEPGASATQSATPTPTATRSATATATPGPFQMTTTVSGGGGGLGCPGCVSAALPPVAVAVSVRGCRGGTATMRCSPSVALPGDVIVHPAEQTVACPAGSSTSMMPLTLPQPLAAYVAPAPAAAAAVAAGATVRPADPSSLLGGTTAELGPVGGTLECNVTSGPVVISLAVPLTRQPFRWPALADILLWFPTERVLRSPQAGMRGVFNSSGSTSSSSASSVTASSNRLPGWNQTCIGGTSSASSAVACLSEADARAFISRTAAAAAQSTTLFSSAISRAAHAVLVSAAPACARGTSANAPSGSGPFSADSRVFIGGVPATLLWVSNDGCLLSIAMPPQLCASIGSAAAGNSSSSSSISVGSAGSGSSSASSGAAPASQRAGCGYNALSFQLPISFVASGSSGTPPVHSLNYSCPPFCPGQTGVPFVVQASATDSGTASSGRLGSGSVSSDAGIVIGLAPSSGAGTLDPRTRRLVPSPAPSVVLSSAASSASFTSVSLGFAAGADTSGAGGAPSSTAGAAGLFFTFACPGFPDPALDADICANASHPRASSCAFGDGTDAFPCRTCPPNALCPGGARAWPREAGYFVVSEASGEVKQCAPPEPTSRCLGWDQDNGRMRCGAAYEQGSYGCLECATGSYPTADGSCQQCSLGTPAALLAAQAGRVFGVLFAICIAAFALLYAMARCLGSSLRGSARKLVDLFLFALLLFQSLAEVSAGASPALLQGLYSLFATFQFEGVKVHSRCMPSTHPFLSDLILFPVLLALTGALGGIVLLQRRQARLAAAGSQKSATSSPSKRSAASALAAAGAALTIGLTALYSRAAVSAATALTCVPERVSVAQAAGLNGADAALLDTAGPDGFITVSLLRTNPSFLCWRGATIAPAALAIVTIFAFLLLYPAAACFLAWRAYSHAPEKVKAAAAAAEAAAKAAAAAALPQRLTKGKAGKGSKASADADTQPLTAPPPAPPAAFTIDALLRFMLAGGQFAARAYWFRALELGLSLVLSVISVAWRQPTSAGGYAARGIVVCLLLLTASAAALLSRPYAPLETWRLPIRVASWLLAALVTATNAVFGASQLPGAPASTAAAANGLSVVVIIGAITYIIILLLGVGRSLIVGARAEARVLAFKRKAKSAMGSAALAAMRSLSNGSVSLRSIGSGGSDDADAAAAAAAGKRIYVTGGHRVAEHHGADGHGRLDGRSGEGGSGRYVIDEADPERKRRIYVAGSPRFAEDRSDRSAGGSAAGGPFAWQGAVGDPAQWSQSDAPAWVRGFQPGGPGTDGAPPSVVSLQSALRAGRLNMDGSSIDVTETDGLFSSHGFTGEGGSADGRGSVFGGLNPLMAAMRNKDKDASKDKDKRPSMSMSALGAHGRIAEADHEDDSDDGEDEAASEGDEDGGGDADSRPDDDDDGGDGSAAATVQQPSHLAGRVLSASAFGTAVSTAAPAPPRPVPSAPPRSAPALPPAGGNGSGASMVGGRVASAPTPARRK